MEFSRCLETRRSIRRYKDTPISRETLTELVKAANMAPSWKNSQTARFYIADGRHVEELRALLPEFNRNNSKNAGALIVSTAVQNQAGCGAEGSYCTHIGPGFNFFDNGLQVENLCLKAWDMGLGTLIMGLYDEKGIREYFDIGENEDIVCVIAVGEPDIEPAMPKRKPIEEIAFFKD